MPLKLTCHVDSRIPVEIEGLTPDWACDKSVSDIERFEFYHGNRKLPLAEFFHISGDPADKFFEMDGHLSSVHWIGAGMKSGKIQIQGNAGRHIGSEMRGGEIHVYGNADGWAGAEMHGGLLHVHGNAGHLAGAAYRGSAKGMTGGTLLIDGDVGNEVGHTMRRGMIAVGGEAGDLLGFNMLAGSVLVFGDCGIRPGAGMRRGTIGMFGANTPRLLPSFKYSSTLQPQILRVMLRFLQNKGFKFDATLCDSSFDLYQGDLVSLGRGEIIKRHQAV